MTEVLAPPVLHSNSAGQRASSIWGTELKRVLVRIAPRTPHFSDFTRAPGEAKLSWYSHTGCPQAQAANRGKVSQPCCPDRPDTAPELNSTVDCKTALPESPQPVQSCLLPKCHGFNCQEESPNLDGSLGVQDLPGLIRVSTALSMNWHR